jgi:hypothetical protein
VKGTIKISQNKQHGKTAKVSKINPTMLNAIRHNGHILLKK